MKSEWKKPRKLTDIPFIVIWDWQSLHIFSLLTVVIVVYGRFQMKTNQAKKLNTLEEGILKKSPRGNDIFHSVLLYTYTGPKYTHTHTYRQTDTHTHTHTTHEYSDFHSVRESKGVCAPVVQCGALLQSGEVHSIHSNPCASFFNVDEWLCVVGNMGFGDKGKK